jgi:hypothetical protein
VGLSGDLAFVRGDSVAEVNTRGERGAPQGAGMPFVWDKLNGVQPLFDQAAFLSCHSASANGINESGTIVGVGCTSGQAVHAMLWP